MAQQRKRKKNSNGALLGLIAVLAVLLAAAIIVALSLPDRQPDPTEPIASDTAQNTESSETVGETQGATETQPKLEGWQDIDGQRYYYEDGTVHTGWLTLDGRDYYFHADGAMAKGTVEIDGRNYFFSSTGAFFHVVNPWNYVPDDYAPDLVDLPDKYGEGQRIDSSCYDALIQMIDDCNAAMNGTTSAYVVSAYRSMERQTNNFNNKVDRVMAANPGMTREEAEKEAATVVAVPGTSEHQLGLAADIIDTQLWALEEEQEDLPAQKWLMENCWRYGFLLRYAKGTTDSTGIIYEPWHYRYLGVELATEIHNSGMTVEQYLESLS